MKQHDNNRYQELIKLILPAEIFEYFDLVKLEVVDNEVHAYLDETAVLPEGCEKKKLVSKGFHPEAVIQDFPLRDKPLFLHIRRRRWLVESTGKTISRDWDSVAKGTRMTRDFATFLKGLLG